MALYWSPDPDPLPEPRYYVLSNALYRFRGRETDIYMSGRWRPLLLPRSYIGPWKRISPLRARLTILRRRLLQ